jgi:hypothetical protein
LSYATSEHGAPVSPRARARGLVLIAVAVAIGTACATVTNLVADQVDVPGGAVAIVNGSRIAEDTFLRSVAALEADTRGRLDGTDRLLVLDKLIDEELLVQGALERGLLRSDRDLRESVTSAMIDIALGDTASGDPGDDELRTLYLAERARLPATATFEDLRDDLEALYLHRREQALLREYLDDLRKEADVRIEPGSSW